VQVTARFASPKNRPGSGNPPSAAAAAAALPPLLPLKFIITIPTIINKISTNHNQKTTNNRSSSNSTLNKSPLLHRLLRLFPSLQPRRQ